MEMESMLAASPNTLLSLSSYADNNSHSMISEIKVRIFAGDSCTTRKFNMRKLSDGTIVLEDGKSRVIQRPKYHPDRTLSQVQTANGNQSEPVITIQSFKNFIACNAATTIIKIGTKISGWFAAQS
jgi:hypothetical protein